MLSGLLSCSEPDQNITGSTADGQFALRMEAEKNWVHADQDLPLRVTLESLTGAFTLTLHKSGLERVLAVKPPCEARR